MVSRWCHNSRVVHDLFGIVVLVDTATEGIRAGLASKVHTYQYKCRILECQLQHKFGRVSKLFPPFDTSEADQVSYSDQ